MYSLIPFLCIITRQTPLDGGSRYITWYDKPLHIRSTNSSNTLMELLHLASCRDINWWFIVATNRQLTTVINNRPICIRQILVVWNTFDPGRFFTGRRETTCYSVGKMIYQLYSCRIDKCAYCEVTAWQQGVTFILCLSLDKKLLQLTFTEQRQSSSRRQYHLVANVVLLASIVKYDTLFCGIVVL